VRTLREPKEGSRILCAHCHQVFTLASPNAGTAASASAVDAEERPSPPWYKDPILQTGIATGALILLAFAGYLAWERHQRVQREHVVVLQAEADALARNKRPIEAYEKYREVIALAEQRRDPELAKQVDSAKRALVALEPAVQEEKKKQEEKRRLEEAARIEELNRQAAARKKREQQELRKQEKARMALIKGELKGGAWIIKKGGHSDIVRGMEVVLIRREIQRGLIDKWLEQFKKLRGENHIMFIALSPIPEAAPEDEVDVKPLLEDARSSTQSVRELSEDRLWPMIVLLGKEAHTITDIDGKYEFKAVKGGDYYVFASYGTDFSYIDWLVPVSIRDPEAVKFDLYNGTARQITNKAND
jgi:hypothetical protein